MDVRSMRNAVLGARVVNALKSRNMDAYYVETKEEAVAKALELMPKGSTISWGRNDERGRSRTDGCHSKRRLHVI